MSRRKRVGSNSKRDPEGALLLMGIAVVVVWLVGVAATLAVAAAAITGTLKLMEVL